MNRRRTRVAAVTVAALGVFLTMTGVAFAHATLSPLVSETGVLLFFTETATTEKEKVGQVKIERFGFGNGPKTSFRFDSALTSAHVEPPDPPFSRDADFASPNQWTGSLSVSFPGDPDVPLAGPTFSAQLGHR